MERGELGIKEDSWEWRRKIWNREDSGEWRREN